MKEVIIINNLVFKFKSHSELRAKEILNSYTYGDILNEEHFEFMKSYFEYFHYEWIQKKGVGVKSISIKKSDHSKANEFRINRIDGSSTDISYRLSNIEGPNPNKWFRSSLRNFIRKDIFEFKDNVFKNAETIKCEINGIDISREECHIDHFNPTFEVLVQEFIVINELEINEKMFEKSKDNQTIPVLKNKNILDCFKQYHTKKSNLRAVSILANLSDLKKKP